MIRFSIAASAFMLLGFNALGQVPQRHADLPKEVNLESVYAIDAFQQVLRTTGLPINVETEELDPKSQGVTAKHLLDGLNTKKNSAGLSSAEASERRRVLEIAKDSPNSVVAWNLEKASKRISATSPDQLLEELCALFPKYEYSVTNGHYTITPKSSILTFKIGPISIKNKSLGEVVAELPPQFAEHHIVFVSLGRADVLKRNIERLELPEVPASEFLTRLVQAAGSDVVWFLGGTKGGRMLGISTN